jgi:hypothetical protein
MRKVLSMVGVLVACAVVAGCNPPPLRAVQQQADCNCHGTVTTANPSAETERFVPPGTRHHRYASRGSHYRHHSYRDSDTSYSGYSGEWSYSRVDESSYSYHSASRIYRGGASAHAYAYAGSSGSAYAHAGSYGGDSAYTGDASHYDTDSGWTDGYGRTYHRARLSGKELRTRMDPWHGYDADCDENGRRH